MTKGQVKSVKIGKSSYNIVQAIAPLQKTLLLLIGGRLSFRTASTRSHIDQPLLIGLLMSLPENEFDQIADIVLNQCVKSGDTSPIDVDSFQGQVYSYVQLVAEGVAFNLDDFFTFINSNVDALINAK